MTLTKTKHLLKTGIKALLAVSLSVGSELASAQDPPPITGQPRVYAPPLLDWPTDFAPKTPDLTEPTSNRIYDLHMQMGDCSAFDIVLSTSGNYHMALTEFWYQEVLKKYDIQNWYFSTSPPIGVEQTQNEALGYSNIALHCPPHIVVGPQGIMDALKANQLMEGEPTPLFTNRGNVILVKKGNPKNIRTLDDLARADVRVATSNPNTEPGSFGNYARMLYRMPLLAKGKAEADAFFASVLGADSGKWVVGKRIHHREVPHLVYADEADAGLLFYHIARYARDAFPEEFDIVPLGGTADNPQPLPGNTIGKLFIARTNVALTDEQRATREQVIGEMLSERFGEYLTKHYIVPVQR